MAKVLIIEDDPQVAGLYREKLSMAGHEIVIAGGGIKGLEKALADKVDIILLDVMMPDMNGIEMLKKLRADARGKDVSVLLLTNAYDPEGLENVEGLYSDYVLKVDLTLDDLIEKVKQYTSK